MEFHSERHIGDILKERNIVIVGADLATRHGFTQVPNFILTKSDITVGAKLAYAMLLKYAWDNDACFPGQLTLAKAQLNAAYARTSKSWNKWNYWRSNSAASARPIFTVSTSRLSHKKFAVPDRQDLPFKSGNHRRSGAANSAALSI